MLLILKAEGSYRLVGASKRWGAGGNTSNWKSWYGCSEGLFIGERVDVSDEEKKRQKRDK